MISAENGCLLVRFPVFSLQETTADQHGRLASAAVIRSLPLDREESLDGVVEVGTILLPVAVLVAPLAIELIRS